eukprot:4050949-Prymnesium_polylepis.2
MVGLSHHVEGAKPAGPWGEIRRPSIDDCPSARRSVEWLRAAQPWRCAPCDDPSRRGRACADVLDVRVRRPRARRENALPSKGTQIHTVKPSRNVRETIFCGNLLILTGTQEGTVPHQDKLARIPWPLRGCKCASCSCAVSECEPAAHACQSLVPVARRDVEEVECGAAGSSPVRMRNPCSFPAT